VTSVAGPPAGGEVATPTVPQNLTGHLRLPGAVALAVTIVVGSGVLVLPGIAYREVGRNALWAWTGAALVMIPLLLVFSALGARYPGAGGVAGFVQAAFGRHLAAGVEVLLLGTFSLGIPGISLTGGNYAVALVGDGRLSASAAAVALLVVAVAVVWAGVRLSTRVQVALAVFFTVGLLAVGAIGVLAGSPMRQAPDASLSALGTGLGAIGVVFFAFTGWEMVSFTTEEYVDPRRDFPRAVAISYVIVVSMYVLLAWAVQTQLPGDGREASAAPIHEVVERVGNASLAHLTSVVAVVVILANLVGAVWAASRLVLSSAREGLMPQALASWDVGSGSPRRAVAACGTGFVAVLVLNAFGGLSLRSLLSVAGENFFVLYLLSAFAFARLFGGAARAAGLAIGLVLTGVAVATFHVPQLAYSLSLLALGAGLSRTRAVRRGRGRGEALSGS